VGGCGCETCVYLWVCVGVVCVSSNLPIVFFLEEEEFAEDEKLSDRHDFLN
jgi:hypothetical protein